MKNVFEGLRYFGIMAMCIYGGTLLLRWLRTDDVMLDQVLGFVVGAVVLVSAYAVKRYYQHEIE